MRVARYSVQCVKMPDTFSFDGNEGEEEGEEGEEVSIGKHKNGISTKMNSMKKHRSSSSKSKKKQQQQINTIESSVQARDDIHNRNGDYNGNDDDNDEICEREESIFMDINHNNNNNNNNDIDNLILVEKNESSANNKITFKANMARALSACTRCTDEQLLLSGKGIISRPLPECAQCKNPIRWDDLIEGPSAGDYSKKRGEKDDLACFHFDCYRIRLEIMEMVRQQQLLQQMNYNQEKSKRKSSSRSLLNPFKMLLSNRNKKSSSLS